MTARSVWTGIGKHQDEGEISAETRRDRQRRRRRGKTSALRGGGR